MLLTVSVSHLKQGSCLGHAVSAAAVAIHVDQLGGWYLGESVPPHQPGRHGGQALCALGAGEDTDEDLPVLVTHVGNPSGRVCSGTCELFRHLKERDSTCYSTCYCESMNTQLSCNSSSK